MPRNQNELGPIIGLSERELPTGERFVTTTDVNSLNPYYHAAVALSERTGGEIVLVSELEHNPHPKIARRVSIFAHNKGRSLFRAVSGHPNMREMYHGFLSIPSQTIHDASELARALGTHLRKYSLTEKREGEIEQDIKESLAYNIGSAMEQVVEEVVYQSR